MYSSKDDETSVGSDGIILLDNDFKCDAQTYYYVSSDIISTDILPLERVSTEIVNQLFTTKPSENVSSDEDVQPAYYTVTFDSNGGSAVDSQIVLPGGHPVAPANPTRITWSFCGWKYNGEYVDFATFEVNSDVVFVADWA